MSAEIIQFIPRPNPEREALIEQARKNYESIFPTDPPKHELKIKLTWIPPEWWNRLSKDTAPCETNPDTDSA